ncbi:MAG: hypothetical protein KDN22_05020 [Verrucomicrobiae bacterium]|nr:hypothetical protein [Verrucomicrobiae bacterium]
MVVFHLSGCESLDTTARGEGTGIQIGGAIYAAIKYKQLSNAEAERVRIDAQRVFDTKVEREVEKQRAKVKPSVKPQPKPSPPPKPKPTSPDRPKPTPTPKPKPVTPPADEPPATTAAEDAAAEKKIRQIAVNTVKAKYGTNIAVPVKNPDNKAVVAFATVVGERVSLTTRTAYELNISGAAIAKAAQKNSPVKLEGAKYALLDETDVTISRP